MGATAHAADLPLILLTRPCVPDEVSCPNTSEAAPLLYAGAVLTTPSLCPAAAEQTAAALGGTGHE